MINKKLLIVWVYYPAVGHLVEAIEVAANYHAANPKLDIHVLLNSETPFILCEYCDFISKVHTVDVKSGVQDGRVLNELNQIGFDYVIFPKRFKYTPQDFPNHLLMLNQYLFKGLRAKIWNGYNDTASSDMNSLTEKPYSPFRIKVPKIKVTFEIPDHNNSPKISVILKGASQQTIWPSLHVWKKLLLHVKKIYPQAVFYITGITNSNISSINGSSQAKNKIGQFINSIPGALNCYNIGLENQLAVIEHSDVLIAPHTGFAFLAPCVGTPWLALSGGQWAEHMPAGMRFYSVLPKCEKYPCSNDDIKLECKLRIKLQQPIKCMNNLTEKKDEIIKGIEKLMSKDYDFYESFVDYENSAKMNMVNVNKIWRIKAFKSSFLI